jgi:hydrogenase 3 maturation protease
MSLEDQIRAFFEGNEKRPILIGVGNFLRGDDAVGLIVIEEFESLKPSKTFTIKAETAPEAYMTKVTDYKPTHVMFIDASNLGCSPGDAKLISVNRILGASLSTHTLPLTLFINYLQTEINAKIILLGIQPSTIELGSEMTSIVLDSAKNISLLLFEILEN